MSNDSTLQLDALVFARRAEAGCIRRCHLRQPNGDRAARGGELLEYAEAVDTVVVWRVDQQGCSLIDVLNAVTLLRERGVNVRSFSDGIDLSTSTGQMMLTYYVPPSGVRARTDW